MRNILLVLFLFIINLCYSQQISQLSISSIGANFQNASNGIGVIVGDLVIDTQFNDSIGVGSGSFIISEIGAPCNGTFPPNCLAVNVVSIFSDIYNDVNVDTWLGSGSVATYTDTILNGNEVKIYEGVSVINIEFIGSNLINASGMKYLHMDFWTEDITTLRVNIFDFGTDEVEGVGNAEMEYVCNNIPICKWNSFLVPVSSFVGLSQDSKIGKIIITGLPEGGSIYFDNIYFCNE